MGKDPNSETVADGVPEVVMVKDPEVAATKAAVVAETMAAPAWTSIVALWVAVPAPLWALITTGHDPDVVLCGVPASVAVPFPLSVSTSPPGRELAVEIEGKGKPVVVMIADIGTSTDAAKEPDEVKAGDDRVATVKLPGVVAVPAMVWTLTGPLVAPLGTANTTEVSLDVTTVAVWPCTLTIGAPAREVPVMVT